jgi:hypothetical protein
MIAFRDTGHVMMWVAALKVGPAGHYRCMESEQWPHGSESRRDTVSLRIVSRLDESVSYVVLQDG